MSQIIITIIIILYFKDKDDSLKEHSSGRHYSSLGYAKWMPTLCYLMSVLCIFCS
jgi:hypothetical protein